MSSEVRMPPPASPGNTSFATSVGLLVLRLALGWVFVYHGSQKLFGAFGGGGMESFAAALKDYPLLPPMAWTYMAALGEFVGGISILAGLLARLGAIPLIMTMLVAIATVHGKNGFANRYDPQTSSIVLGYEFNLALLAMAAAVLLAGPGLISLDAFLFRRGLWSRGPQPLDRPGKEDDLARR